MIGPLPISPSNAPHPSSPAKRHALHLYTVLIDASAAGIPRDAFMTALHRSNIGTGVHYRQIACHPIYQQRFGWRPQDYPVAQAIGEKTVSLPLSAKFTSGDVDSVIEVVRHVLGR